MERQKTFENPYLPKPYKVLSFTRESSDSFTIKVDMRINHEPGQFVQVSVPGIGECPISICSDSNKYIELNIREVGNVTNALSKLKKGSVVFVRGPYGNGYPMRSLRGNNILIIGGGCGVAPLRGIIEFVANNREDYEDVNLFLGYRSPADMIFKKETKKWKKDYQVDVSVDKVPHGQSCHDMRVGFITDALKEMHLDKNNRVVFICGPPIMMRYVIEILKNKGFNDKQIFISAERLMYCALGVCCHCMIKGKFTCIDGPVFRYDEVPK
ncbi:FAD/NAD(P)-binding protein [Candidatus Woesearchaeota archaeon]|nr:FAD/NAD(P)-binding protein [Candidatus Woesearchaeota archaeon]